MSNQKNSRPRIALFAAERLAQAHGILTAEFLIRCHVPSDRAIRELTGTSDLSLETVDAICDTLCLPMKDFLLLGRDEKERREAESA